MKPTASLIFASLVLTNLAMAAPAQSATTLVQSGKSNPDELLEEGTRKILRAFELFIQTIPQYEMPEVMPNGDIIIRRKNPDGGKGMPEKAPDTSTGGDDKTKT